MVRDVLFCKTLQNGKAYQFQHQLESSHPFQEAALLPEKQKITNAQAQRNSCNPLWSSRVMGVFCQLKNSTAPFQACSCDSDVTLSKGF